MLFKLASLVRHVKLRRISINNFLSIWKEQTELEDLVVLVGSNNSGKTNFIRAIRLIFENIGSFREKIAIEKRIYSINEWPIDTLWFFEDSGKGATISAIVELDEDEERDVKEKTGFKKLGPLEVEVKMERANRDEIKLKLNRISLRGYVTELSKKADEVLKTLNPSFSEDYTELKLAENGKVIERGLLNTVLSLLEGKVHYVNAYEGVEKQQEAIPPHPLLPKELQEALKRVIKEPEKKKRFYRYSMPVTGSVYHRLLEKREEMTYLKYYFYGGGDQVVDSLIATVIDKGRGHVFLIEEPEIHLHPSYIKRLSSLLNELVKEENVQIIMTTHSPVFVKHLKDVNKSLYVVRRIRTKALGGEYPSTRVIRLANLKKCLPEFITKWKLFFSDALVLVEGLSDEIIISRCIEVMDKNLRNLKRLYICYLHYAQRDPDEMLEIVNEVANLMDIPKFIIADGDKQGEETIKKARKKGFEEGKEAFRLHVEDIFFVVTKETLNRAINKLLVELKLEEEVKAKEIRSKKDLENLLNQIEECTEIGEGRAGVKLARILAGEIKEEDVDDKFKELLHEIDNHIEKYIR